MPYHQATTKMSPKSTRRWFNRFRPNINGQTCITIGLTSLCCYLILVVVDQRTDFAKQRPVRLVEKDAPNHDAEGPVVIQQKQAEVPAPAEPVPAVPGNVQLPPSVMVHKPISGTGIINRFDKNGKCNSGVYGKLALAVIYVTKSYETHYGVAQSTIVCYAKRMGYPLILIDMDKDPLVKQKCNHTQLFFKKHCAAAAYLETVDYMYVLDADTGIVNQDRCLEEYIDDRVDMMFYERFFNWEIASGNYIVKNTPFAVKFLRDWADYQYTQPKNFNGADNGVLQIHILRTILPESVPEIETCDTLWHNGTGYQTYMRYVTCCKIAIGSKRIWPPKLMIYRRAHGWVQDWYMTSERYCPTMFMFHGWKHNEIGTGGWKSPFERKPNETMGDCVPGAKWPHREKKLVTCEVIREQLARSELGSGRGYPAVAKMLPYQDVHDIGLCFPNCTHG